MKKLRLMCILVFGAITTPYTVHARGGFTLKKAIINYIKAGGDISLFYRKINDHSIFSFLGDVITSDEEKMLGLVENKYNSLLSMRENGEKLSPIDIQLMHALFNLKRDLEESKKEYSNLKKAYKASQYRLAIQSVIPLLQVPALYSYRTNPTNKHHLFTIQAGTILYSGLLCFYYLLNLKTLLPSATFSDSFTRMSLFASTLLPQYSAFGPPLKNLSSLKRSSYQEQVQKMVFRPNLQLLALFPSTSWLFMDFMQYKESRDKLKEHKDLLRSSPAFCDIKETFELIKSPIHRLESALAHNYKQIFEDAGEEWNDPQNVHGDVAYINKDVAGIISKYAYGLGSVPDTSTKIRQPRCKKAIILSALFFGIKTIVKKEFFLSGAK